MMSAALS
jgi:hypothetical protein